MRKTMMFFVMLGMWVGVGGTALAGGLGTCDYSKHVNQANANTADAERTVATKPATKTDAEKLLLVQADKMHQAAPALPAKK